MSKKFLAILLAIFLTTALAVPAFAADFTDTADHWAESSIERWADHGIIQGIGDGVFDPDGSMTRAQAAVLFSKLLKLNAKGDISKFGDVDPDAWYAEYIAMCVAAGILNGVGDDAMDPNGTLTREQMMTMLCRAVGIKPEETSEKEFSDSEDVSDWAAGYVNALTNAGIVSGVGNNAVAPADDINRASMMALLDKGISTYADKEGETVEAEAGKTGIVLVAAPNVTVTGEASSVAVVEGAAGGTTKLDNANVGSVTLTAANTDVVLGGNTKAESVDLTEKAAGSSVKVDETATAGTVTAAAPESKVEVEGTVEEVSVSATASNTTVDTGDKAQVGKVDTAAEGTTVSGTGTVENVTTSGNNTTVETGGTKVEAAEGTTGTTAGGETVEGGESTTTEPVAPTPSAPSGGGGGGGGYVPTPSHSHSYTYTPNNDSTHYGVCANGDGLCDAENVTNEACGDWVEGSVCEKCGFNKDAVAVIGTTYYATLAEAVAVGGNITLLKNVVLDGAISVNNTVTLDLNGNNITMSANDTSGDGVFCVVSGGNLTLNDSSETNAGTVNGASSGNEYDMTLWAKGGAITINGGTYTNVGADASDGRNDMIYAGSSGGAGGTITINGGYFESEDAHAGQFTLNVNNSNGTIVVKGGSFKGYNPAEGDDAVPGPFVAPGYVATEDNGTWTVEKDKLDTAAELAAAVAAGGTVKLEGDITLSETLVVAADKNVTLDLNGYDISYSVENTNNSNKIALQVKGTMEITGAGEISIITTGIDMGWNAMSTVVHVDGGNLTVGGEVTLKNLGGTAMAFALDMNPWSSGPMTINLNGTTLESTYIPIRVRDGGSVDITFTATECTITSNRVSGTPYAVWLQCYDGTYNSKTTAYLNNCTFTGAVLGAECENSVIYVNGVADKD